MMPRSEVEKEVTYCDDPKSKYRITIQAGPNGWSILYSDYSTSYNDNPGAGTETNFKEAYDEMKADFPNAYEVNDVKREVIYEG